MVKNNPDTEQYAVSVPVFAGGLLSIMGWGPFLLGRLMDKKIEYLPMGPVQLDSNALFLTLGILGTAILLANGAVRLNERRKLNKLRRFY